MKTGIYKHKKNGKSYKVMPFENKMKENSEWVDAITYQRVNEPFMSFTRSLKEFNEKFVKEDER